MVARGPLPFAAVVFDMDGVLIDSEPLHYEALRSVLAEEGHEWTRTQNELLLGTTVTDSFRIIGDIIPLSRRAEAYIPIYDRRVTDVLRGPLEPAPGALRLIRSLADLRVPMAVASSSLRSWIDATITSLDVGEYFRVIVSGQDVERGKPAPDIYVRSANVLGVASEHCIAIEDAPNGIESAHRAGMPVIAVRTAYTKHLSLEHADVTVSSLEELRIRGSRAGLHLMASS